MSGVVHSESGVEFGTSWLARAAPPAASSWTLRLETPSRAWVKNEM